MEWFRFALTALFLGLALISMITAVLGNSRFGFIMNRIHAAGIGDTVALFFAALAAVIGMGELFPGLKIFLVVVFMWCTSPVATHFLAQIEYYMNDHLEDYVRREDSHDNP